MTATPYSLFLTIAIVTCSFDLKAYDGREDEDSVMTVLVEKLKLTSSLELISPETDSVRSQTYSYMGFILNADSAVVYRLLAVETEFMDDSVDRKLVIFDNEKAAGFFQIHNILPYRIVNYKYLTFDKTIADFNGHQVHVKINLSAGIPQHFNIGGDEFLFISFDNSKVAVKEY
jgi:hypothetical protein